MENPPSPGSGQLSEVTARCQHDLPVGAGMASLSSAQSCHLSAKQSLRALVMAKPSTSKASCGTDGGQNHGEMLGDPALLGSVPQSLTCHTHSTVPSRCLIFCPSCGQTGGAGSRGKGRREAWRPGSCPNQTKPAAPGDRAALHPARPASRRDIRPGVRKCLDSTPYELLPLELTQTTWFPGHPMPGTHRRPGSLETWGWGPRAGLGSQRVQGLCPVAAWAPEVLAVCPTWAGWPATRCVLLGPQQGWAGREALSWSFSAAIQGSPVGHPWPLEGSCGLAWESCWPSTGLSPRPGPCRAHPPPCPARCRSCPARPCCCHLSWAGPLGSGPGLLQGDPSGARGRVTRWGSLGQGLLFLCRELELSPLSLGPVHRLWGSPCHLPGHSHLQMGRLV